MSRVLFNYCTTTTKPTVYKGIRLKHRHNSRHLYAVTSISSLCRPLPAPEREMDEPNQKLRRILFFEDSQPVPHEHQRDAIDYHHSRDRLATAASNHPRSPLPIYPEQALEHPFCRGMVRGDMDTNGGDALSTEAVLEAALDDAPPRGGIWMHAVDHVDDGR